MLIPPIPDIDLTTHQIATPQTELRRTLSLADERFPLSSFIGIVSDEIYQLRVKGQTDSEIARLMAGVSAIEIGAEDIERHYASPEARADFHG